MFRTAQKTQGALTMQYREEKDALGPIQVPAKAYYGAGTQRAVDNFGISGLTMPKAFIFALARIKKAAAEVNLELGLLDAKHARVIAAACDEVASGQLKDQFPVDVFQTGSGTSTNMNLNEVVACRANQMITGKRAGKAPVHPNDHVNLGQSSNDIIPTALHLSALLRTKTDLFPALERLHDSLRSKAVSFEKIPKIGRTHLQDAVPMTLGNEFGGYARQIQLAIERIKEAGRGLKELAIGGTAVGTGINAHPKFASRVIDRLNRETGIDFREAVDHFEAQGAKDAVVGFSGALRTLAISLVKIANDIRWLASGPRCGIGEIVLPALQPGSSIMPGKINPVLPEAILQVAAQVMGNDTVILLSGQGGNFELNVMMPVMIHNLHQSLAILARSIDLFTDKCIAGIQADEEKCRANIANSLMMATYLVPHLGYDETAKIARKAYESGSRIVDLVVKEKLLPPEKIDSILSEFR
jgi:fumarate hydratase class II